MSATAISGSALRGRIDEVDAHEHALMSIGREVCPACQVQDAGLQVLAAARPELPVYVVSMDGDDDWSVREDLLWPRDIRVSRAATPALVLLHRGRAVATHHGALPAHDLDAWVAAILGPAASPVPPGVSDAEQAVLDRTAPRRAQHAAVKGR